MLLYNYDHIDGFLAANPHISNKLACLVRELLNLPHLKVIYAAFALMGVQLVEPFYARTITKGTTHSQLKVFYKELHSSLLETKVDASFLTLSEPLFPGVSVDLFTGVKLSYGEKVLQATIDVAQEHAEDVVLLINHMLPEMATILARQRRDYGIDPENFPVQFPVEEQASNIDDTPTNNMDMERLMGKTDYRLKKLQALPAASRSIILQKTRALREAIIKFKKVKRNVEQVCQYLNYLFKGATGAVHNHTAYVTYIHQTYIQYIKSTQICIAGYMF